MYGLSHCAATPTPVIFIALLIGSFKMLILGIGYLRFNYMNIPIRLLLLHSRKNSFPSSRDPSAKAKRVTVGAHFFGDTRIKFSLLYPFPVERSKCTI